MTRQPLSALPTIYSEQLNYTLPFVQLERKPALLEEKKKKRGPPLHFLVSGERRSLLACLLCSCQCRHVSERQ